MRQDYGFTPYMEGPEDTLERLVQMTNQTSMVALHKTLTAVKRTGPGQVTAGFGTASERVRSIAERVSRAAQEVASAIPDDERVH